MERSGTRPEQALEARNLTPLSLLERLHANDETAWERVLLLYGPLVRFWCQRSGVRGDDVEDIFQEVFAAAAAGFGRFHKDKPGDTFRGWLRGITRRQVLYHFHRLQGRPVAEGGSDAWRHLQEVADPSSKPDEEEAAEVQRVYLRALENVRGRFESATWQAFWFTSIEGRVPAELVAELHMTPAAIRQAKSRVLRCLKQELGELLE